MRTSAKRALTAFSFANCCFLNTWEELAQGQTAYWARHDPLQATVPAVLVLQAILFVAAYGLLQRACHRAFAIACVLPAGASAIALLRALPFDARPFIQHAWFGPLAMGAAAAICAMVLALKKRDLFQKALLWGSPVMLLILAQAWISTLGRFDGVSYRDREPSSVSSPASAAASTPRHRVIWIIFDELCQAMAFDNPVVAPEFERLRRDASFFATDAHAPADATKESIPSLLLGDKVTHAEPVGPATLLVRTSKTGPAGADFASLPNVLTHAVAELGVRAAIVGWYHPYGRLFGGGRIGGPVFWTPGWLHSGVEEDLDEPSSFAKAIGHRLRCQWDTFPLVGRFRPADAPGEHQREETVRRFEALREQALAAAADPTIGLVFLHLPVPHPPSVYDRGLKSLDSSRRHSYLDGVALAGRTLGEIRQSVDRAGLAGNTAIVVTADHGWRDIWPKNAEERVASAGRDMSAAPFVVVLPGSRGRTEDVEYRERVSTLSTGEVVLRILRGERPGAAEIAGVLSKSAT